jgi:hypothetical protein
MKKLFLLAFAVLMVLIVLNRQRVYVRNPLATVYRNDVKQGGVEVYINYSNDVLLEKLDQPGAYTLLLQHWNQVPGSPQELKCIRWMACLADADHATTIPLAAGKYDPQVSMSDRAVSFVSTDGAKFRVTLR